MINKICLFIFTLIFLPLSALADQEAMYTIPLEWQKVELQKEIEVKLNHGMQSFAPSGKFIVDIQIILGASKKSGFGKQNSKTKKGKNFSLDKLGLNRNSQAFKKAISSGGQNSIFSQIKTVNVRIILDPKIGREQVSQIRAFVSQTVVSYTGKKSSMSIKKSPLLNVGETAKEKFEIAKLSMESVKLVAEAITKSNDKIAIAIAANQGIDLKNIDGVKEVIFPKTWQAWVVDFKLPIGIVIATVLLLMGISGFKTFEGQKVSLMAAANAQQVQAAQSSQSIGASVGAVKETEESAGSGDAAVASGSGADSGFDQFRKLAEEYPDTAMYLIKLWLNMDTQDSQRAMAAITKMIPVESLIPTLGGLEDSLKLKLKRASSRVLGAEDVSKADVFIIGQLVDIFLVDTLALPEEVKNMLADSTVKELAECVRKDTNYGPAFVNVLQTAQVGRLFSLLSAEEVTELLEKSLDFNTESIQYLEENLAASLEQIRQDKQKIRVPIIDKSLDLIRQLGAEGEHQVFTLLITAGDQEQLREAAKMFYPAQLFTKFPKDQIRTLLSQLSTTDRARLIFSRPAEDKKIFMAAVGKAGRLKDIIDSELKQIQASEQIKKQIQKTKGQIWNNFIRVSREAIKSDAKLNEVADTVLSKWFKDNGVDDTGESDESLAA